MRAKTSLTLLLLLVLWAVGCDRQDNDWRAYEPDLRLVSVVTDTLNVAEGANSANFAVSLGMVPADTVLVRVFSNDEQLTLVPDSLVFAPVDDQWAEPQVVNVIAVDDHIQEGPHSDSVTILSESRDSAYAYQTGEGAVPVQIADNDSVGVTISETHLTLVESEAGVVRETYRVRLTSQPVSDVTINTTVVPEELSLHVEPSTLVFTAENWDQLQEVILWIELDEIDSDDQLMTLEHEAASDDPNYGPELIIPDLVVSTYDFTLPPIARIHLVDSGTLYENEPTTQVLVRLTLDRPSAEDVTLHLATGGGTALAESDYHGLDQDVIFPTGTTLERQFSLSVINDTEIEPLEDFEVVITPVENVIIGEDDRVSIEVVDNDLTPLSISVTDVDEDSGSANFLVSIPFAETVPVSFTFTTFNGTALAGEDYEAHSDSYVLEPGETVRSISVVLNADAFNEPDETFSASLSDVSTNASYTEPATVCTILNDDPQTITLADVQFSEDDGQAQFTLNLLAPYNHPVTLAVSTLNGDGVAPAGDQVDAISGMDFSGQNDTPWVIPPYSTSATFAVPLLDDSDAEALYEYFQLEITAADQAGFLGLVSTCTLVDTNQPCLLVADVGAVESDPAVTFSVQLLDESLNPVTSTADVIFHVQTADQTAEAGIDYTAVSQTVTIPAGDDHLDIPVALLDDGHDDDNETFVLVMSQAVNALGSCGTEDAFATLTDDEYPSLNLQAAVVRLNEGSVWEFTVYLSTPRQDVTTYDLILYEGSSNGVNVDYTFAATGTHTMAAMATSTTFTVPFLDDQLPDEVDEVIRANISNADVALGVMDLESTIVDAPELSIGSAAANEGETAIFDVFLDEPSTADIQFSLQFANDTATMGADFNDTATGPYTFLAGETATTVPVQFYGGDGGDAAEEIFVITVVAPANATVSGDNSGIGTITDMDPPILSLAGDATGPEGGNVAFIVDLSWSSEVAVEFEVSFIDGTAARAGIDYDDSNTGPFAVPAGNTSFTVPVPAVADGGPELTLEDFTIILHSPVDAVLGMPLSATGYVQDMDQPELSIPLAAVATEGDNLLFNVHLSEQSIVPVFFRLQYDLGSTNGSSDFVLPPSGLLSMMPGTTDTTITIMTVEDANHENQEAFILRLANPVNGVLGSPFENNGIINDDDP